MKKLEIKELKKKMGLDKISNINPPEDYSSIIPDKWYYVIGDGGMKGRDVIARHITMSRVMTWKEHKEQQERLNQLLQDEKDKREAAAAEIPF